MLDLALDVIPQCLAVVSPLKYHSEIIEQTARKVLGTYRPSHPDLIIIGTEEKAPTIEACRDLIERIMLKPMESKRRLAVIMSADKLLVQAANSLLKLSEEPPSHAVILFLMEDSRLFLPTLRSRAQMIKLKSTESITPSPYPKSTQDWIQWLNKTRKASDQEGMAAELESWSEYALISGDVCTAERAERLKIIASRKNLSVPMLCDVILLTLKERKEGEKNNEHILDDIWQA